MTHYERFLQQLPPDRRVEAALILEKLSHDRDSPIFGLYAEILAGIEDKSHEREERLFNKLAESAEREKQLPAQIAKGQADTIKTVRGIVESLTGKGLGWRIMTNKFVGTIIFVIVASIVANHIIQTKVRTVDPEYHARIDAIESKITKRIDDQAQLQNVRVNQVMDLVQETNETISKTHVTTASQTLIGKALSLYVSHLDEKYITLEVGERVGERRITVPHGLTPQEFNQLDVALKVTRKIK